MMNRPNFESIYDQYCPMLYGIALQICESKQKAEELLMATFRKINEQDIYPEKYPAYCITLIHLILKTAKELYPIKFKNGFRLKQFENTPLMNQIICDQLSLRGYCNEKFLTQQEASQVIREEISFLKMNT